MNLGTTEIIIIVAIIFLLFGASRLPQLAKSIGQSKKAFKEGLEEAERDEQVKVQKNAQIISNPIAPQVTGMSDDELMAEIRRRDTSKQII